MPMTKRQEQKIETRAKILNIAAKMFSQKGFRVTTSEIAKEAGLSNGAIFVHFPSKENLVDCVMEAFYHNLNMQIHYGVKRNLSIEALLYTHLNILIENEPFYKKLLTQLEILPENTKEKLFACQSTLSIHFEQVLLKEKEQKRIVDIPFHMIFNLWIGLVHYYLQNSEMFIAEGSVILRFQDELVQSYLKMIFIL